jgi:hypothetical protein
MIEHAEGGRVIDEGSAHPGDQMIGFVTGSGIIAFVVLGVTGLVLPQRLAPVFLKPLASDAPHDLGEESV